MELLGGEFCQVVCQPFLVAEGSEGVWRLVFVKEEEGGACLVFLADVGDAVSGVVGLGDEVCLPGGDAVSLCRGGCFWLLHGGVCFPVCSLGGDAYAEDLVLQMKGASAGFGRVQFHGVDGVDRSNDVNKDAVGVA